MGNDSVSALYENKFDGIVKLEDIINIPVDSDIGYFFEVDINYPDNIEEKTKNFPFCPENKFSLQDKFSDYMNETKPKFTMKRNQNLHRK